MRRTTSARHRTRRARRPREKNGTNASDERPSALRSSRSPGSKSCSAKTKASSAAPSLLAEVAAQPRPATARCRAASSCSRQQDRSAGCRRRRCSTPASMSRSSASRDSRHTRVRTAAAGCGARRCEGERDAVLGGCRRRADEADGAGGRERDPLAGRGDAEVGARRDIPRAAGDGIEKTLQRERARRIERDDELQVRAADRPDVAVALVRDERVAAGGDYGGAIVGARRRRGEQAHQKHDRRPTGHRGFILRDGCREKTS